MRFALLLAATAVLWLTVGLYGREPWKADEAYTMGIVHSIVADGRWGVPTLAGEPFMEKPPLVFWLAALFAKSLSPVLPMHVAARGANVLCALLTFVLVAGAARELTPAARGREHARQAVLWLAICPAWLFASRYLTADLGLMPAAALSCWGLQRLRQQHPGAGWMLGAGAAVGLMAKGVLLPGVVALSTLALLVLSPTLWRRATGRTLAIALGGFALLGLIWPIWLGLHAPELLKDWLWDNNFGRFFGSNALGPAHTFWQTLGLIVAMALPVWPVALWRSARRATQWRSDPLLGPLLFAGCWGAVLCLSATSRGLYALPMLVPLSLLAAAAVPTQRLSATKGWQVAMIVAVVGATAIAVWAAPVALFAGASTQLPVMANTAIVSGLLALAWWVWLRRNAAMPIARDGLYAIAVSLTLLFAVTAAAWLPHADRQTGFRELFMTLSPALTGAHGCVAGVDIGESERGMLDYYVGLRTRRVEVDPEAGHCPRRFEQQRAGIDDPAFGCPDARVLWEGRRRGHAAEVFRLCGPRDDESPPR